MAKPEYAIREVSLAEVILFLLSVIILAAYHFDYRVATYIIFLDFFSRSRLSWHYASLWKRKGIRKCLAAYQMHIIMIRS